MKRANLFVVLMAAIASLAAIGCEKGVDETPEPTYCYECLVTTTIDRGSGYAGDVSTSVQGHCGITTERARKLETEGTFRKQQPDQWGIRLVWVIQKTECQKQQ